MNISNQSVIDEWSQFSDEDLIRFGDEGDAARKELLDPVVLDLAGDIRGKKVLDAGCGNGYLSRKLAKIGALVEGFEPSTALYQYCINREKQQNLNIKYIQQDLSQLNIIGAYDTVFLINVLMDIPNFEVALLNCVNALKPGGEIIISVLHPCFPGFESDWQQLGFVKVEEYFNPRPIKQKYGYLFQRPLHVYINTLIDYGCGITRIIEPGLMDGSDSRNTHVPQFLVIKAKRS